MIKHERISTNARFTSICFAKYCRNFTRQQDLSLRDFDLYQDRLVHAVRVAALGRFLLHHDGISSAKHRAVETESSRLFQHADGNNSQFRPWRFEYDDLPLRQLQKRPLPQ